MRICLFTETALPKIGGQELVVDALARRYTDLGHEVVVLSQPPRKGPRPDDRGLPYRSERHPRYITRPFFVSWYRRYLRMLHERFPFDVVHCHSVHPCGYAAVHAAAESRPAVPIVITSHGGDVRADNPQFRKWRMRERCIKAIAEADALTSISRFTTDGYVRLGADARRIIEIPNGVEADEYRTSVPRPIDLPEAWRDRGYLLFLGRLNRRKGVDLLLEAYARTPIANRLPLVVAGDGDERPLLESQVAALGLGERVTFVGKVGGEKKKYLLQQARAVVSPSRGWEAFPLVVLEAYAAGTPVVASRAPGLRDLVDPEQTGLLFDEESVEGLAAALTTVCREDRRAAAWGETACARAKEYDWRVVAERYLSLFQRLIDERRRRAA